MLSQSKMNAMKRIYEEYISICQHPIVTLGVDIDLIGDDYEKRNIFNWGVGMLAPNDTPYEGGLFVLDINFPEDYPNSKPEVVFRTPIYHVNVNPIKSNMPGAEPLGHVYIPKLNCWKPEYKMEDVLTDIFYLFYRSNPESPYCLDRVNEVRFNTALHEEKIRYFTKKYAELGKGDIDMKYFESWDFTYNK